MTYFEEIVYLNGKKWIASFKQELIGRYRQLSPDGSECGCLRAIAVFKPGSLKYNLYFITYNLKILNWSPLRKKYLRILYKRETLPKTRNIFKWYIYILWNIISDHFLVIPSHYKNFFGGKYLKDQKTTEIKREIIKIS